MRIALVFSLVCAATAPLMAAQSRPAWRAIPHVEFGYGSDGGGMNGDWTVASGTQFGAGAKGMLYVPKEDSMGWALYTDLGMRSLMADLEGTMKVPDGAASGASATQNTYFARIQSGPFYRLLGLWGASGGVFGMDLSTTESDERWYRQDYALFFGVFSEIGSDPWAKQGLRGGLNVGRMGGDQIWDGLYSGETVSDSSEWLREGFEGEATIEYWRGPAWAQLVGHANSISLRHRSEEGSRGDATYWSIGLRLGYRFALGNLEGFR